MFRLAVFATCLWSAVLAQPASGQKAGPRIVNIYNFVRENDYRLPDSEAILYEATKQEVRLVKQAGLPATFAFQYDALVDPKYQSLVKEELGTNYEIGAWWEIPELLAEKAGIKWRGHHEWDPAANVGFSPGYTPEERRKLVDAYMADFKEIFGYYPRTVGSWYIDEVTLAYMGEKYGVIASCNCKDQIGTDGYTLWGGYWNQAYYPSRVNAYMPAQTKAGQFDVPIFRMLGSDPIYQHGTTPGLYSLEPVYGNAGGSTKWVDWFMDNLIRQPSLAFAYTQAGQENSFGWDAMKNGLTYQIGKFAEEAKAGQIRVETLAQSGKWFRQHYGVTPATSMIALDDWKNEGRKTVWYDSRFYRLNMFWQSNSFCIRDLHCFDENIVSPTHDKPLEATSLAYFTQPIMDTARWAKDSTGRVGIWPVLLTDDGTSSPMKAAGDPKFKEMNLNFLRIEQDLEAGGKIQIDCEEARLAFSAKDSQKRSLRWGLRFVGGAGQKSVVQTVSPNGIKYRFDGASYELEMAPRFGSVNQLDDGDILIEANRDGRLVLQISAH